ncbi:MAG: STAS domain-containing protein [Pseudanabaenaceae cyanobacterium]
MDKFINGYSQEPASTLILDLSGLEFVSSAGLRIFAKARKMMKNKGGQVLLLLYKKCLT